MARIGQLILIVLFGLPSIALAQGCPRGGGCDQGAAYAAASTIAAQYEYETRIVPGTPNTSNCATGQGCYYVQRVSTGASLAITYFAMAATCDKRSDYNGVFPGTYGAPKSGSVQCNSGCIQVWTPNADSTWNGTYVLNATCNPTDNTENQCAAMSLPGYHYNNYTHTCEPDTQECPAGKEKNAKGECADQACPSGMKLSSFGICEPEANECPAGQVKAPSGQCLPGDGQCAQGEAKGKDGTCKRDSDGDGQPDEGEDDGSSDPTFSGGDSCDSPPSCSGDVIMCGQARIQWRIDCNTRKNRNVSGGTCDRAPVCTGEKCDAMEYSSLLFQWRSACAAEKLLSKGGDAGSGDSQPDWTKVSGDGTGGAGAEPDKPHRTVSLGIGMLDEGGFLPGSGQCPKFGSVDVWKFGKVDLDQWPWICSFFAAVRIVLIGLGAFIAFGILAGRTIF